jgi:hypothetical protein
MIMILKKLNLNNILFNLLLLSISFIALSNPVLGILTTNPDCHTRKNYSPTLINVPLFLAPAKAI